MSGFNFTLKRNYLLFTYISTNFINLHKYFQMKKKVLWYNKYMYQSIQRKKKKFPDYIIHVHLNTVQGNFCYNFILPYSPQDKLLEVWICKLENNKAKVTLFTEHAESNEKQQKLYCSILKKQLCFQFIYFKHTRCTSYLRVKNTT